MSEWINNADFIEADIIQWQESLWAKNNLTQKNMVVGNRVVTAEVLREDTATGFVTLRVLASSVSPSKGKKPIALPFDNGEQIRRARKTIEKSRPWRLPWSDENARALLIAERDAVKPGADTRQDTQK
ncbi:hypothetical protein [Caballeronia sp. AZ7_KS35]|uniref:hypothetical protein n=1 Tax=Caballeronia sp. AZ7_KS35 TaxID=2921762 RepID=UPI002028B80D|nr:hypothetical protein [Caballeronia sp. AZ7_KS35]